MCIVGKREGERERETERERDRETDRAREIYITIVSEYVVTRE